MRECADLCQAALLGLLGTHEHGSRWALGQQAGKGTQASVWLCLQSSFVAWLPPRTGLRRGCEGPDISLSPTHPPSVPPRRSPRHNHR